MADMNKAGKKLGDCTLKKCPFCGGDELKVESKVGSGCNDCRVKDGKLQERHSVSVRCNKCHARGPVVFVWLNWGGYAAPVGKLRDEAIRAWNAGR